MSIVPSEAPNWNSLQWLAGAATAFATSVGAVAWRVMMRLERVEAAQAELRRGFETSRAATDAALLRLAERFAQLNDDHFRLRETLGGLPTRGDLRDSEDRLVEQIAAVIARLDRVAGV